MKVNMATVNCGRKIRTVTLDWGKVTCVRCRWALNPIKSVKRRRNEKMVDRIGSAGS